MEKNIEGFNLVLLGKTGAGKSAAGNTILGRQAFKSEKSPTSVTQDVDVQTGTVCGLPVTVYDTPGFCDTELEEHKIQQKCQSILQKCSSEISAFFLVIKADRFTEEERKTVEKIEKLLGQNRLEKTWLLFTRGDELEDEKKTIKEFINDTDALKKLVQKYDQRYHVFNNKKRGPNKQVKKLITEVLKTCLNKEANGAMKRKQTKSKHTPVSGLSSRRIVLLGKSGVGKSAAGNTILGQKKFRSVRRMKSVTRECSEAHSTVSGRSVSVVDTPGFFDIDMNHEELLMEIARSVFLSSPGPHAFLIVLRVDERFTELEKQIPQMIEMLFGEEVLKYSIILFTHGDDLEGEPIEEVIKESNYLRDLVDRCGGRYHVFNNRDVNNREQVHELLQKIDTMIEQNRGGHYSNQMYEDAHRLRQEEEERRLREEEERKQQEEKQRQEEIERVRTETEEKTRAEIQSKNETKQEEQRTMETDIVVMKLGEKTEPECEPQSNQETCSGFKLFFSKYKKCFSIVVSIGVVIGAVVGGVAGAMVGGFVGAVDGTADGFASAFFGAVHGVVAGGAAGAAAGAAAGGATAAAVIGGGATGAAAGGATAAAVVGGGAAGGATAAAVVGGGAAGGATAAAVIAGAVIGGAAGKCAGDAAGAFAGAVVGGAAVGLYEAGCKVVDWFPAH